MVAVGESVQIEKYKIMGIQEQLDKENKKWLQEVTEVTTAEAEWQRLKLLEEGRQKQFDEVNAENFQLRRGKINCGTWPRLMVYPKECDYWEGQNVVEVRVCCLCKFPFPYHNIVVSSCLHFITFFVLHLCLSMRISA